MTLWEQNRAPPTTAGDATVPYRANIEEDRITYSMRTETVVPDKGVNSYDPYYLHTALESLTVAPSVHMPPAKKLRVDPKFDTPCVIRMSMNTRLQKRLVASGSGDTTSSETHTVDSSSMPQDPDGVGTAGSIRKRASPTPH